MQIEITGGTIEVRDRTNIRTKKVLNAAAADLREVLKRKYDGDIEKIKDAPPDTIRQDGELMDVIDDFSMRALCVLLESWTRPEKMPTTVLEWLEFVEPDDAPNLYQELTAIVTPIAYARLGATTVAVSPETAGDPESFTVLSSDLNEGEPEVTIPSMSLLPG